MEGELAFPTWHLVKGRRHCLKASSTLTQRQMKVTFYVPCFPDDSHLGRIKSLSDNCSFICCCVSNSYQVQAPELLLFAQMWSRYPSDCTASFYWSSPVLSFMMAYSWLMLLPTEFPGHSRIPAPRSSCLLRSLLRAHTFLRPCRREPFQATFCPT
jgi:hypothetical protein